MNSSSMNSILRIPTLLLGSALATRLVAMALLPLMDTSEPRYAETARIMAETGDWITPFFDYGVPFWGKPPLSFWSQALAFRLLGVGEFAVRLPSLLATLGILWLIFTAARQLTGRAGAWLAVAVYATSALGYVMAGAVVTDPFLTLGTTLAMAAAVKTGCGERPNPLWGYLLFAGLGIGLLAKGPLALVLVGAPLGLWLLAAPRERWRRFPWFGGTLLMLAISLPWYLAAEWKTPGFLDYFIVGEHFKRFVDPGWNGDLYGTAHVAAPGTIWWYAIQASFPWGLVALGLFVAGIRRRGLGPLLSAVRMDSSGLLLAWCLWPLLFFTLAGNILWTYVQPALPPFAILLAMALERSGPAWRRWGLRAAALVPLAVLALTVAIHAQPQGAKTEKQLVQFAGTNAGRRLLFLEEAPFSARFYAQGHARAIEPRELREQLANSAAEEVYIAVHKGHMDLIPAELQGYLEQVFADQRYLLFRVTGDEQAATSGALGQGARLNP